VQKAYLDKFADNGRIDVINRQDGTVRAAIRTKNTANVRGLYTVTNDNGEKDGSLEGAFAAEIEEPAIKVINNMTSIFPYVPQGEERLLIADYMAFQYLRTPEAKRRFELETGRLTSIQLFNLANKPDKIREHLTTMGRDSSDEAVKAYRKTILTGIKEHELVPVSNMWFPMIHSGMQHVAPTLVERFHWHLYYYDVPTFLTSDHPIVLRRIYDDHRGIGFANADEVMFPLSKNHALLLTVDAGLEEGVHVNLAPKAAEMLNYFLVQSSYLEIYSPPSLTGKYAGRAMGKRPIVTAVGGLPTEIDFLSQYTGFLDRDRPRRD